MRPWPRNRLSVYLSFSIASTGETANQLESLTPHYGLQALRRYADNCSLPQINKHCHCIELHYIVLRPQHLDRSLHIVGGGILVAPEDIRQVFTAPLDNQVSGSL